MITVALNVLGFITAVLLGLLLLILLLILVILLVPVSYACDGHIDGKYFSGLARVSWLFGLVSIVLDRDRDLSVRILGICVWRDANNSVDEPPPPLHHPKQQDSPNTAASPDKAKVHSEDKEAPKHEKTRNQLREKLTAKIKRVWRTFKEIKDYSNLGEIVSETTLLAKRVLKTALPKRLELSGSFGFEDPSTTGFATGIISAVAPFIPRRIKLHAKPDFEREVVKLKLLVRGSVSAILLVIPLCRFLFSKPVWKLVRKAIKIMRRRH